MRGSQLSLCFVRHAIKSSSCHWKFFGQIDQRLRRINDAVRIRHLHAEVLEEPLKNGVEEGLLLVKVRNRAGGVFNRAAIT